MGKGLYRVIWANIINLTAAIINGVLLPKYLSITEYANYKMFILYISYAGTLHFGFADGVLIKYGGINKEKVDKNEFSKAEYSFVIFQMIISIIVTMFAWLSRDLYMALASLSIVPINVLTMYKFFFQAIGEFDKYGRIYNFQGIGILALNIIVLFLLNKENALYYCMGYLIVQFVILLYFFVKLKSYHKIAFAKVPYLVVECKKYIGAGIVVMLGNFMAMWITSIDRWFVRLKSGLTLFGYYSFAVSTLRLVNVFLGAFSVTFYNLICVNQSPINVANLRKKVIIVGAEVISASFLLGLCVKKFLPNYNSSVDVMVVLIATQLLVSVINSIYLNLFKALNKQKIYIDIMICVSIVAIILNCLFGFIGNNAIESYAYATLATTIIWLLICQLRLKSYKLEMKEWFFIGVALLVYFGVYRIQSIISVILYIVIITIISCSLFANEVKEIVHDCKDVIFKF